MTDRYDIITDHVKKFGVSLFFVFFMTKIKLASSEMREWKSGLKGQIQFFKFVEP